MFINGERYNLNKADGAYFVSLDDCNVANVEIYLIPEYFEKLGNLKFFLFTIENLLTGGSGFNAKEIRKEMTGKHITLKAQGEDTIIDLDNDICEDFKAEEYLSENLCKKYKYFVKLPFIFLVCIVVCFLIWVVCKIIW